MASIVPDKRCSPIYILLISPGEHHDVSAFSFDRPHQVVFNEYPENMFLWRNKKNIKLLRFFDYKHFI